MLKPNFEKGSILKQNMLEAIRDYPYVADDIFFADYGEGIISGFEVKDLSNDKIVIGAGILKTNGKIFYSEKELLIEQKYENNYVYLEVAEEKVPEGSNFYVDIRQYDVPQQDKIELFRYTRNAELFMFQDVQEILSVPINRINRINAAHSIKGGTSLCKEYYKLFAYEVLKSNNAQVKDVAFAYQCLNGIQDIDLVRQYFGNDGSNEQVWMSMKQKMIMLSRKEEIISEVYDKPQRQRVVTVS